MNILITQSQLFNYSGSEILTLEVADEFVKLGHSVAIVTAIYDTPIKTDHPEDSSVKIYLDSEAQDIVLDDYDLLWIHHSYIPESILKGLVELRKSNKGPLVVYNHMSYVAPLEIPLSYQIETDIADLVLFNAQEVKDELSNKGFTFEGQRVELLDNAAPSIFWNTHTLRVAEKKILLVSNHPPVEVTEALEVLKSKDYEVQVFGRTTGGKVKRVEPDDIKHGGIVISIGKTVQYCLAAKTPIYCYDYFGGPGFLDQDNFSEARYFNFSGRGFNSKTSNQIVSEIMAFDKEVLDNQAKVAGSANAEFNLTIKLKNILTSLEGTEKKPVTADKSNLSQFFSEQALRLDLLKKFHQTSSSQQAYKKRNVELKSIIGEKDLHVVSLLPRLKKAQTELDQIKSSKTYKILLLIRRLSFWKK